MFPSAQLLNPSHIGFVKSLSPLAWYRKGMGMTIATGVSQWDDQSGNGLHLTQASAGAQPALQADGRLLFDGVDDFMTSGAVFSFAQPYSVFLAMQQVTWTTSDRIFDLAGAGTQTCLQAGTSPTIRVNCGAALTEGGTFALATDNVLGVIVNGASSIIRVNETETAGDMGANAPGATLTLGAVATPGNFGHLIVGEILIFGAALSVEQRARVNAYLRETGGVGS